MQLIMEMLSFKISYLLVQYHQSFSPSLMSKLKRSIKLFWNESNRINYWSHGYFRHSYHNGRIWIYESDLRNPWSIFHYTGLSQNFSVQDSTLEHKKGSLSLDEYLLKTKNYVDMLAFVGYFLSTSNYIKAIFNGLYDEHDVFIIVSIFFRIDQYIIAEIESLLLS